jgi:flavin-binding protein dodecin
LSLFAVTLVAKKLFNLDQRLHVYGEVMSALLGGLIFYLFINTLGSSDSSSDKAMGDALQVSSDTFPQLEADPEFESTPKVSRLDN